MYTDVYSRDITTYLEPLKCQFSSEAYGLVSFHTSFLDFDKSKSLLSATVPEEDSQLTLQPDDKVRVL
ncbi:hypothetical protein PM082_000829 [Marasmius tenuissimus]|nr:hypothetical protein PM082_000829 [Marasmius tenuissimus]